MNTKFQQLLKQYKISFFTTENDDIKAAIVKRFNRTLKEKMWRFFTYSRKKRYIDELHNLVASYNASKHRTIGMAPKDVTIHHEPSLLENMYNYSYKSMKVNLAAGNHVRISMARRPFQKGYIGQWSDEIFIVQSMVTVHPPTYCISDLLNESVKGTFYQ